MFSIKSCPVPESALLNSYHREDNYCDCYSTNIDVDITLRQYVQAFYTTPIFRLERLILQHAVSKPSSDEQVDLLANGSIETFAAWSVEARSENQLLMCDFRKQTRSWFMVVPTEHQIKPQSRLYFGSAVVGVNAPAGAKSSAGLVFKVLLRFHKLYSVILLNAARSRLKAQAQNR